jgi:diguanylate cyclase (GGDEF)-like protein
MPLTLSLMLVLAAAAGAMCDRIVVHRTIRRLRRELAVAAHDASHDRLTGLLNRGGLEDAYTAGTDTVRWLLVVDLDAFKTVNDRHGHPTGDLVLAALGARIQALITAAAGSGGRLGGDEFAVLLPRFARSDILRVAGALAAPITATGCRSAGPVTVTASVGITAVSAGLPWKQALTQADIALYQAKQGHQPILFRPAMTHPRPPWPRRRNRDHDRRPPAERRSVPPRRVVLPRQRPGTNSVRPTGTGGQPS